MIGFALILSISLVMLVVEEVHFSKRNRRIAELRRVAGGHRRNSLPIPCRTPWQGKYVPCRHSRRIRLNLLNLRDIRDQLGRFWQRNRKFSLRCGYWQGIRGPLRRRPTPRQPPV